MRNRVPHSRRRYPLQERLCAWGNLFARKAPVRRLLEAKSFRRGITYSRYAPA
jgi:hypothetical protein